MFLAQSVPESDVDPSQLVPEGLTARDWIIAAVIIVAALALALVVHRVVVYKVAGRSKRRAHIARLVGRFAAMIIFATGIVYALTTLGVRIGPLLGALGILGLALAFALQDILKNLMAGIVLQASSPFKPGDQIEVGEWEGTVEDVDFRTVVLRTFDDTRVVLPSAMVADGPIENITAFRHRLTVVTVSVAYDSDLREAEEVLTRAVRSVEGVEMYPSAGASIIELGDDGVKFAVYFWHPSRRADMLATRHRVFHAVKEALDSAGITIPFPQRRIWLGDDSSPTIAQPE